MRWMLVVMVLAITRGPTQAIPPPRHSTSELLANEWLLREEGVRRCAAQARAEGRWGVVILRFKLRLRGRPTVTTTRSPGITPVLEACVRAEAREALKYPLYGDAVETTLEYEILLGDPPALLPPIGELLPAWQNPAHRSALARRLPAEVTLSPDGCILNETRVHLMQARQRWLDENTRRVSRVFNHLQTRFLGPGGPRWGAPHWVSGRLFVIGTGRGQQEALCLATLDQERIDAILADARDWVRCLDGGSPETLVDPRLRFPPGRGFREVGVAQPSICALDRNGAVECCGYTQASQPPAGRFRALTLSQYAGCALDDLGRASCWNHAGPVVEGRLKSGRFSSLALQYDHGCAVQLDGLLTCWGVATPQGEPLLGRYRATGVSHPRTFAIDDAGALVCRGPHCPKPTGTFVTLAPASGQDCALRGDGAVVCWRLGVPVAAPAGRFLSLAATGNSACAVGQDGRITCWGETEKFAVPAPPGRFARVSAGNDQYCGVTSDGEVVCWGDVWPGQAMRTP